LTDSGRLTHKVVTRPAISLAQDRERSPAVTGVLTTMLRLILWPRPTSSETFVEICSAEIRCKMSVYAISPNGKESWKMIQDPRKNRDRHQKGRVTRTCHDYPSKTMDDQDFSCSLLPSAKFGDGMSSGFYQRDAMLARVFATATCLSVRLDVRLSHAGIVPSRAKAGS